MVIQINESALRHGVTGMYNIRKDGSYNVFHAMKCRKEFYHYVEESGYYV
jgi:ribosomal protein L24E